MSDMEKDYLARLEELGNFHLEIIVRELIQMWQLIRDS